MPSQATDRTEPANLKALIEAKARIEVAAMHPVKKGRMLARIARAIAKASP